MKLLLTLAVAVAATVILSGCADELIAEPVSVRQVQATSAPAPSVEPVAPSEVLQPIEQVAPVAPAPPTVQVPAAPAPVAAVTDAPAPVVPIPVAPIVEHIVEAAPVEAVDPFAAWLLNPTFECDEGLAPGWLSNAGVPTGCVAN
ncbi:hypothetical protein [Cryobacterium aureum]|uniref:hypothetical protein n=1 Tax=Cryobacterium aureum TaxID=995037 RepID=UPI000CF37102|nr:hypothetical protein [Cryobacterium aureum]